MNAPAIEGFDVSILRGDADWGTCATRNGLPFTPNRIHVHYYAGGPIIGRVARVMTFGWVPRDGSSTLLILPDEDAGTLNQATETWIDGDTNTGSGSDAYWASRGGHDLKDLPEWICQAIDTHIPELWRYVRGEQVAA